MRGNLACTNLTSTNLAKSKENFVKFFKSSLRNSKKKKKKIELGKSNIG